MDLSNQSSQSVEKIVQSIMNRFGYRHLYEVSNYFEVTAQTLSGWIKADKIPAKHLLKYYNDFKTDKRIGDQISPRGDVNTVVPLASTKFSLAEIYFILSKNIKTLVGIPFFVLTFAFIYLFFIAHPVYTSTAKILPTEDNSGSVSDLMGAAAQFGINIPLASRDQISWDELYPEIIKSHHLKKLLLGKKFTTRQYGSDKSLLYLMVQEENLRKYPLARQEEMAIERLSAMIRVTKGRLTSIVTLEVHGFEPQFVADLASLIIQESSRLQREFKTNHIRQKRSFISDRIKEVKQEVRVAEIALKEFREANKRLDKSPSLQLELERLEQQLKMKNSLYLTLQTQYEKARIQEVEKSAMIQVIDEPIIPWRMTRPKRGLSMLISGFLSLAITLLLVYTKEYIFINGHRELKMKKKAKQELVMNLKKMMWVKKGT